MNFHNLKSKLADNFDHLQASHTRLFEVEVDKDELWNLYLDSFPPEVNPLYRVRREYDCSTCRHFIKTIGNVVFIDRDMSVHTIWGFDAGDSVAQMVVDAMDAYVKSKPIAGLYLRPEAWIGAEKTYERDKETGAVTTYEHFFVKVPDVAHHTDGRTTIDTVKSRYRDTAMVFKRSLEEITDEAIRVVLELISSNTLYKGAEWKAALESFDTCKGRYMSLPPEQRERYVWKMAGDVGGTIGRIRNHSIGVLLTDISQGMELEDAVKRYEKIVAPENYKRPKAIFTAKMLEEAREKLTELGYIDALPRRYAKLDDITVNNILFSNRDAAKRIGGSVFDEMLADVRNSPKRFDRVEEIPIERFISDVLPGVHEIEAFVENRHASNMVSLIAPVNPDAKTMFKWDNGFSWAYSGNITDSSVKENVKAAGGKVDGVLRFSIQWNDEDYNPNDFDAHCTEPGGNHIYFGNKGRKHTSSGMLDVDIINPIKGTPAVENIVWSDKERMHAGKYELFVHCYSNVGGRSGFKAEVEFDGQIHSFAYDKELRRGEVVAVANVVLNKDGQFMIKQLLPSTTSSREVWGVKTQMFAPVTVVMYSPNYWDGQGGIGHKHYMFMLKDCVNPERPNGFYNEFLKQELVEHKRVFEALGSKMAVEMVEDQLSGLGFSATKRNDLIVKVKGATERIMKIKF